MEKYIEKFPHNQRFIVCSPESFGSARVGFFQGNKKDASKWGRFLFGRVFLRTEVKGDFNIHGTKNFQYAVFLRKIKNL